MKRVKLDLKHRIYAAIVVLLYLVVEGIDRVDWSRVISFISKGNS